MVGFITIASHTLKKIKLQQCNIYKFVIFMRAKSKIIVLQARGISAAVDLESDQSGCGKKIFGK